jgi:hypothetical protein
VARHHPQDVHAARWNDHAAATTMGRQPAANPQADRCSTNRDVSVRSEPPESHVRFVWRCPREWRQHALGHEPYWVEEELLLLQGTQRLAQLSFDEPLDDRERERFEHALLTQSLGAANLEHH